MKQFKSEIKLVFNLILILVNFSYFAHAQQDAFSPQLFDALSLTVKIADGAAQDTSWQDYRLMDSNGFLSMIGDVLGPQSTQIQQPASSRILWSQYPKLKPQIHFDDFGGTCDYNNPSMNFRNQVRNPQYALGDPKETQPNPNSANGLESEIYQDGVFNSCDNNPQFTRESFLPNPVLSRFAWIYRSCKMISVRATSEEITRFANRIQSFNPLNAILSDKKETGKFNWCEKISLPTMEDYDSLFKAFYPGRSIPKSPDFDYGMVKVDRTFVDSTERKIPNRVSSAPPGPSSTPISPDPGREPRPPYVPMYYERLVDLVKESNEFISKLDPSSYLEMESSCNGKTAGTMPTLEQMKAINAWRALLMVSCMDPGAQVL